MDEACKMTDLDLIFPIAISVCTFFIAREIGHLVLQSLEKKLAESNESIRQGEARLKELEEIEEQLVRELEEKDDENTTNKQPNK